MKVKVFKIRLTKEHLQADQEALNSFMETVTVTETTTALVQEPSNFWSVVVFYEDQKPQKNGKKSNKIAVTDISELTEREKEIFDHLKQWRLEKASQMNVPSFVVCHNTVLMTIAKLQPQAMEDFLTVKGFGEHKITKFGEDILAVLNAI